MEAQDFAKDFLSIATDHNNNTQKLTDHEEWLLREYAKLLKKEAELKKKEEEYEKKTKIMNQNLRNNIS